MAAKGCPGIVVESNNYIINVDDPMSVTSVLYGGGVEALSEVIEILLAKE